MRVGLTALAMLFSICALASGWMFHEHYWRWRNCFNELGRCFVPETGVVLADSNFVWGLMSAVTFALVLLCWMWSRRLAR
jgi:ABC-type transporter Mla maintaining outer membrane lipid asymmetry permease subunit MlaE